LFARPEEGLLLVGSDRVPRRDLGTSQPPREGQRKFLTFSGRGEPYYTHAKNRRAGNLERNLAKGHTGGGRFFARVSPPFPKRDKRTTDLDVLIPRERRLPRVARRKEIPPPIGVGGGKACVGETTAGYRGRT